MPDGLGYSVIRNREWLEKIREGAEPPHVLTYAEVFIHPDLLKRWAMVLCDCGAVSNARGTDDVHTFLELVARAISGLECIGHYPSGYVVRLTDEP